MGQSPQQSIQFLAIGDWGMDTDHQKWIADQMSNILRRDQQSVDRFFVAALGDNFYPSGVKSVDEPQWFNVFTAPFSEVKCPWYPILGNHDWEGNPQAQIDFKTDLRWQMEDIYYTKSFGLIELVFIDTSTLCPEISEMFTGSEFSIKAQEKQWKWLEKVLKRARNNNKWIIVFGHYPVHSGGCSGTMREMLRVDALFTKYGVSVYFSGHDHSLQHLYSEKSKIHYFVSGSGCESVPVNIRPDGLTKFCTEKEGFMSCTIKKESFSTNGHDNAMTANGTNNANFGVLNVKFVSHDGSELYNVNVCRNGVSNVL